MSVFNIGAVGLRGQATGPASPKDGDIFYANDSHAT